MQPRDCLLLCLVRGHLPRRDCGAGCTPQLLVPPFLCLHPRHPVGRFTGFVSPNQANTVDLALPCKGSAENPCFFSDRIQPSSADHTSGTSLSPYPSRPLSQTDQIDDARILDLRTWNRGPQREYWICEHGTGGRQIILVLDARPDARSGVGAISLEIRPRVPRHVPNCMGKSRISSLFVWFHSTGNRRGRTRRVPWMGQERCRSVSPDGPFCRGCEATIGPSAGARFLGAPPS